MARSDLRARATGSAIVATMLALAACQVLAGLERAEPSADASAADVVDAAYGDGGPLDPCGDPPPRPPQDEVPGDLVLTFAAAYITLDVSKADAARPFLCPLNGLNLDGKDTCRSDDAGSCFNPTGPVCDLPGGVDDSVADLFPLLQLANIPSVDWNTPIRLGRANLILVITAYNGAPNDSEVGLATYLSTGLTDLQTEAGPDGFAPPDPPINYNDPSMVWDGSPGSTWTPDIASIQDGIPVYRSTGWVANGMLVAEQAAVPIPFNGAALESAHFTAQLVPQGDTFALRYGRIAGSLRSRSLLRGIGSATINGHQLCEGARTTYETVKPLVCRENDLRVEGNEGRCDALSFAFGFVGVPASMSKEPRRGPLTASSPCDGSFDDDCDFLDGN